MPAKSRVNAPMREGDPYIQLTFQVYAEDDGYVSECVELDLASQGDTIEEALVNIKDCVEVHVESLHELGELNRFLREHNVRPRPYRTPKRTLPVKRDVYPERLTTTDKIPV